MISYSIIFLNIIHLLSCINLPCDNSCATCSSATQCTTCASQYYPTTINGTLQCLSCSQFCLVCISSTNCTVCISPYVIQSDGSCRQCQISNAVNCKTIVSASQCEAGYYLNDNYCYSCLLNCADCSSNSDCRSCIQGYFLNSTVLTCNFCPTNCSQCDQFNSIRCLSCKDGYGLSSTYTCDLILCQIQNCLYCQSSSSCLQCNYGYYWDSGLRLCVLGSAIMCQRGSEGPYPNQCNKQCKNFYYLAQQNSTAIWCLPYTNISIKRLAYYQFYAYAYNSNNKLNKLFSTSRSLTLQSSGQYSFQVNLGDIFVLQNLPPFYRVTIFLKYRSQSSIIVNMSSYTDSANVNQSLQSQSATFPAHNLQASVQKINTIYLHSDNIKLEFKSSLYLVQILIRTLNCPSYCLRCLNNQLCQFCKQPQYMSSYKCVDNCTIYYHLVTNRTCLTSCPDLFYPVNLGLNQKFCQPCVSPCAKCVNQTQCVSCQSGKYLYNYTCVIVCPDYYYGDVSGVCAPCISPCKLCINQTSCISCKQGYWNNLTSTCIINCPDTYYGNNQNKQCQLCQSPCLTCRNTSNKCLTCGSGLYYKDYNCLSSCPDRFYPNTVSMVCNPCVLPCYTCSSNTFCLTCSNNYLYNNQCIQSCPDGYYQNLANKSCLVCSSYCRTCQMPVQCTSCQTGKCILEGSCLTSCPSSKYFKSFLYQGSQNQSCSCLQCIYPCKQCLNSSACISCLQGYLFAATYECLNTCPAGYFPNNVTFQCSGCSTRYTTYCIQCNTTSCIRCNGGYLLHNGQCLSQCPTQHYKSSQTCQKCVAPCFNCTSFSQCSSCISPYLFNNGSCIIQCPFGQISYFNTTVNMSICIICQRPCVTCQNSSPTNCTMCEYGYFLYSFNNSCLPNCSSIPQIFSFYDQLVTSTCSKCMFPCKTCSSQTVCLTCQIGFLTLNGKCQNCPYGTFANSQQGICNSCPSSCSNCYSLTYCIGCNFGYYLFNHQCISNITICQINGYYPIGRICQLCQMPCAQCNITSTNCLSCLTGYIFYPPNQCITQCPKGTFRNSSECSPCHSYCSSCSGSPTYCFACNSGYFLIISKMQCVLACPDLTFAVGPICQLCQYPCERCISQMQCTSCVSGTLVNHSCWNSCPSGYFSDANMTCQRCQSPCLQCQIFATNCRQCQPGTFLYQNQCLSVCPALFFGEENAHQCLQCLGLCLQCSSHINCTTCGSNLIFYYDITRNVGQCVGQCPYSFYNASVQILSGYRSQCKPCLAQCSKCTNDSQCITCKNNKSQYEGRCLTECPPSMYTHTDGVCKNCSPPCLNCSGAFTCTACMNDSFLLVGSAECIVGQICPLGFYRIPNSRDCNSTCPPGLYYRNDRTCNAQGCDLDQYKGADMHCYQKCPDGYKSDKNYNCISCKQQECKKGLFYDITPYIIRDKLVMYLIFTQDPIYLVDNPVIKITPNFENKITILKTQRLLQEERQNQRSERLLLQQNYVNSIRNITIQLFPTQSFSQMQLKVQFQQALATFENPIQRTYKIIILPGLDIYPDTPAINLSFLLLACALLGIIKNPYMTDFAQLIYLMALTNLHYPKHLGSALQSCSLAHLHKLFTLQQTHVLGKGKFSYITDMGLLSNSLINLLIITAGLLIFFILFVVYHILKKATNYNKIEDQNNKEQMRSKDENIQSEYVQTNNVKNDQGKEFSSGQKGTCLIIFECLHFKFIQDFKMAFLNRLIYFNYLPISVFTITQLYVLQFNSNSTVDLVASILSIVMLVALLAFPLFIFIGNKPKFTFLMYRKFILAVVLVLSIENPTYMIGVTCVMLIMTGILVGAYGIEKWKVQTKFYASMQIAQAFLLIQFAIFAIIGEGRQTTIRLYLGWAILFTVIIICLSYLIFSVFCFVLWGCKRFRNVDYIQMWKQQQVACSQQNNSQTNSNKSIKQKQSKNKQQSGKTLTLQKLLTNMKKQGVKQKQEGSGQKYRIRQTKSKIANPNTNININNNQLFWTYNDNQQAQQNTNEPRAPEMLIRCVNQFSDYDQRQKQQRRVEESRQTMRPRQNSNRRY